MIHNDLRNDLLEISDIIIAVLIRKDFWMTYLLRSHYPFLWTKIMPHISIVLL
jgi:hypothetical protein